MTCCTEAFGWEIPTYVHCSPVMRDAQNKMSKRHGDPSYEDLKAQGYLTEAILNYVALLGWAPKGELAEQEVFSLPELVEAFDIAGISKSPAIFDIEKLDPLQRHLSPGHGPGGLCQGRGALYPPGGEESRHSTPPPSPPCSRPGARS